MAIHIAKPHICSYVYVLHQNKETYLCILNAKMYFKGDKKEITGKKRLHLRQKSDPMILVKIKT